MGEAQFSTEWRGIPTERSGLSYYAICLPRDALPDVTRFSDPHASGRDYGHYAAYDDQMDRVVCYLECRSRYGSFDFDLTVRFHRDAKACRSFKLVITDGFVPSMTSFRHSADWMGSADDRILVQQFFENSKSIVADRGALVVEDSGISAPIVTGGVSGAVGAIGNDALVHARSLKSGSAGNVDASTASNGAMDKLAHRAISSPLVKIFGIVTLVAAAGATALLVAGVTDIGIAGYAVAVISLIAAVIRLLRD